MRWPWLAAAALLGAAAAAPAAYRDGPPAGHTGGFGEPTCVACHLDGAEPDPRGGVEVAGFPAEGYRPGERYLLRVMLRRPGMRAGGFQLAVRAADGSSAGTLEPTDARTALSDSAGVVYAQHARGGSAAEDSAGWEVAWTAPASPGPLHLHVAANAADGDDSPLGDHIYTAAVAASPE